MARKNNEPLKRQKPLDSSWEGVQKWYRKTVGEEGHYYHQHVVMPGLKALFCFCEKSSFLDLACGQGILSRNLPEKLPYVGIDISPSLIKEAKQLKNAENCEFIVGDASKPLPIKKTDFSHAAIVLALQNIEHGQKVIENAYKHLRVGGKLYIVLNHPCFRIPRQSNWGVDESKKLQYRRVDRYQSPLSIPIQAEPSKMQASATTWSFHNPLSTYFQWLTESGFVVVGLHEWCSDKESTGKAAKMENRGREEFPLFLTLVACKAVV